MNRSTWGFVAVFGAVFTCEGAALANGLEAPTSASARYAAIGAASASSVDGPDAVVLNPAGLARSRGLQLTLNAMPIVNRTSAPLTAPNQVANANIAVAPMGELFIAYEVVPGLGIGGGVNVAGGLGAKYGAVHFGDYAMDPEVGQMLGAVEASLGAGYAITDNFSVGAAWRISYMRGDISMAQPLPTGMLQALSVEGASGSSFDGFRFGAQYRADDDRWGLGASVRTPVEWKLQGPGSVAVATPQGASPEMPIGDVSLAMVFPLQVALGADFAMTRELRLFGQYSFSNYAVNETQTMEMAGMQLVSKVAWNDRHTAQAGVQYMVSETWAVRGGYVFESAVVPTDRPSIFAPPSHAHSFALGTGGEVTESLRFDVALVFNTSTGTAVPAADFPGMPGEYSAQNFVGSASASYKF